MCHNECTLPCRVTACNAVKLNAVNNIERYLVLSVSGQFGFAGTVLHVLVTASVGPLLDLAVTPFLPSLYFSPPFSK